MLSKYFRRLFVYSLFIFVVKADINFNVVTGKSNCPGSSINLTCNVHPQTTVVSIIDPNGTDVVRCTAPLNSSTTCPQLNYTTYATKLGNKTTFVLTIKSLKKSIHSGTWKCKHGHEISETKVSVIAPLRITGEMPSVTFSPEIGGTVLDLNISGHVYCQNSEITTDLLYSGADDMYAVLDSDIVWSESSEGNYECNFGEYNKKYTVTLTWKMTALTGKSLKFKMQFNQRACNKSFISNSSSIFLFSEPPSDMKTQIKYPDKSLIVEEGAFLSLQCEVKGGIPISAISWNCFNGTVTNASVNGIARSNITFKATTLINGQLCTCSATHPAARISNTSIPIYIKYMANITSMDISGNNFTISEHSNTTVTCNAVGLPLPVIKLRNVRNNTVIAETTGKQLQHMFSDASCEDTGTYTCEAVNKFNNPVSISRELYVLCAPRRIDKTKQQLTYRSGETLYISTTYLAYPKPDFSWFFQSSDMYNKTELVNFKDNLQLNNTIEFQNKVFMHGSLIIRDSLQEEDFGEYTITAINEVNISIDHFYIAKEAEQSSSTLAAIGYGLGLATFVMIMIILVFALWKKKCFPLQKAIDKEINDGGKSTLASKQITGNNEGPSDGNVGKDDNDVDQISVLTNKDTLYSKVQKLKTEKNAELITKPIELSAIYAMVNKPRKTINVCKNEDDTKQQNASKGKRKAKITSRKQNKDGLAYVDIEFQKKNTAGSSLTIRGVENRTNYAEVDFTKRADPMLVNHENRGKSNEV